MNKVFSSGLLKVKSLMRPLPHNVKDSDFILASFPKSGNTWARFVFSNLLKNRQNINEDVNFHNIEMYSPAVGGNNHIPVGDKFGTDLARPIKTHHNWCGRYVGKQALLIVRDPERCLPSYLQYLDEAQGVHYPSMKKFLNSMSCGLPAWNSFHRSWLHRSNCILHYEDLVSDPVHWFGRAVEALHLPFTSDEIELAVSQSSRKNMKEAELLGDPYQNDGYNFVSTRDALRPRVALSEEFKLMIKEATTDTYSELRFGTMK